MADWEWVFTELVTTRGRSLLRYAYLLCGEQAAAADLVQEGLLRTFRRTRLGDDLNSVEAYVRTAILRAHIDDHRRTMRWRAVRHLLANASHVESSAEPVVDQRSISVALAALSPRQRACIVLRFYEDLPIPHIAAALGCREGTVKRHLSDGLARMAPYVEFDEESRAR